MHVSLVTPLATTTFGGIREVRNQFFFAKVANRSFASQRPAVIAHVKNALPHATLIKGGGSFLNDWMWRVALWRRGGM